MRRYSDAVTRDPSSLNKSRAGKIAGFVAVGALHAGLLAVVGLSQVESNFVAPMPPIQLELIPPVVLPPPPAETPPEPAVEEAGGSPGASSPVRLPERPPERPPEIVAPPIPTPAPTPPPVIGVSPVPTPNPNPGGGQGGEGTGSGTGIGSGTGPGRGGSTPPRIVRGPSQGELRSVHPPAALRAGRSGEAVVSCYIRPDQYLDRCRVVGARPAGEGFDEAGLMAARFYRFQAPTRDGVVRTDQPVTITVQFGRPLAPQG